jgi:hypothetical protein
MNWPDGPQFLAAFRYFTLRSQFSAHLRHGRFIVLSLNVSFGRVIIYFNTLLAASNVDYASHSWSSVTQISSHYRRTAPQKALPFLAGLISLRSTTRRKHSVGLAIFDFLSIRLRCQRIISLYQTPQLAFADGN